MRIVIVTAKLPFGATEAFIIPELREFQKLGHEVLLVPRSISGPLLHDPALLEDARCEPLLGKRVLNSAGRAATRKPAETAAALRLLRGSRSWRTDVKNAVIVPKALWLAKIAEEWGADHLHCHWGGTTATLTMLASELSRIPWSVTLHRWDIVEANLLAAKARHAAFVRFISDDGMRMAQTLGVPSTANARVLRMGVEMPARVDPRPARKPVVLCPARLVEVKGHRYLLEAWRAVKREAPEAELWLAGSGELLESLQRLAASFGISSSVRFLGALPHQQLLNAYTRGEISVTALASIDMGSGHHEGVPVALIEAMSYEVPVVATATGGISELIRPGTGLLVPHREPVALAEALLSLLKDEIFARTLGHAGRQQALSLHDVRDVARRLTEAFAAASAGEQKEVAYA